MPGHSPVMAEVVAPLDHEKVYGGIPLVAVALAVPLHVKQLLALVPLVVITICDLLFRLTNKKISEVSVAKVVVFILINVLNEPVFNNPHVRNRKKVGLL